VYFVVNTARPRWSGAGLGASVYNIPEGTPDVFRYC